MAKHLSVTKIKTYLKCPLSYKFRYEDKIVRPPASAVTFGRAVHHVLDTNYSQKVASREDLPIGALEESFSDYWNKESKETAFEDGEKPGALKDEGIALINAYHRDVSPGIQPVSVERPFEIMFENVDYTLRGYIDLVDDRTVIIDHKTTKRSMTQDAIDADLQLTAYALAYRNFAKKKERALRFDVMVRNKTPKVQHLATSRSEKDIGRFLKVTAYVAKAVQSGIFFPNENFMCSTCAYRDLCNKW